MREIIIQPSAALYELSLEALVGRRANIVEVLKRKDGTIRGCWASLIGEPYLERKEWFIPYSSFIL
ncbi:MAG: hypothetical protein SPH22_09100 [Prevotella sp.]|nr:hypothetical protein [Prevotella sp.]MDY5289774.1 hypothetical protein [Prevotella sp.]